MDNNPRNFPDRKPPDSPPPRKPNSNHNCNPVTQILTVILRLLSVRGRAHFCPDTVEVPSKIKFGHGGGEVAPKYQSINQSINQEFLKWLK